MHGLGGGEVIGRYLRVQEAAALLGVTPATMRWYSLQGWLPTYRVGRGRVSHRRFRYADLRTVARRTGRFLAEEPRWDQTVPITLEMAAQYLGLSSRYLTESGWWTSGTVMAWDDLIALERQIYAKADDRPDSNKTTREDGEMSMMQMMSERCGCRCGPRADGPDQARTTSAGWPADDRPQEDAGLIALRRAKRHLEVSKADLEDQISEIEERIRLHPDNNSPA